MSVEAPQGIAGIPQQRGSQESESSIQVLTIYATSGSVFTAMSQGKTVAASD